MKDAMSMTHRLPPTVRPCLKCLGATAAILTTAVRAKAQDDSAFHEIETKYIFGFSIGAATGIEGEKALEPDTVDNFGKRGGTYTATETELEFEFTPNQYPRSPTTIFTMSLILMNAIWGA
jgi:hypothetical protein